MENIFHQLGSSNSRSEGLRHCSKKFKSSVTVTVEKWGTIRSHHKERCRSEFTDERCSRVGSVGAAGNGTFL